MNREQQIEQLDRFIDALQAGDTPNLDEIDDHELKDLCAAVLTVHQLREPEALEPEGLAAMAERVARNVRLRAQAVDPVQLGDQPAINPNGHVSEITDATDTTRLKPRRHGRGWFLQGMELLAAGVVLALFTGVLIAVLNNRGGDGPNGAPVIGATETMGEIVFERYVGGDGESGIHLVDADGSNLRRAPGTQEGDGPPAWSPDGRWLAFTRPDQKLELAVFVMAADGSELRRVSQEVFRAGERTVWSPDGTHLAFVGGGDPVPLTATQPRRPSVTPGAGVPPGRVTAFVRPSQIYVVERDGKNLRRLTNNPHGDTSPTWSPDGSQIAFVHSPDARTEQIWVMDADGTNQHQVSHDLQLVQMPTWSPTGDWIAFTGYSDAYPAIYLVRPDGSEQRRLLPEDVHGRYPAWSPDGRQIVFISYDHESGHDDLYVINVDGSGLRRLAEGLGYLASQPAWSPDGKWIAVAVQPRRGEVVRPWHLKRVAADGEAAQVETLDDRVVVSARVSWRPAATTSEPPPTPATNEGEQTDERPSAATPASRPVSPVLPDPGKSQSLGAARTDGATIV